MAQKSVLRLILEPIAAAVILALLVRSTIRLYSIPSASMEPTLFAGDRIVVTPYRWSEPARGDVIVFRSPERPREWMVKRVIARPGDLVDAENGKVRVRGHAIPEPYVRYSAQTAGIAPQIVASERYFVLGDHRENSLDSRHWGTVPRDLIAGRALLVLWSSGDPHRDRAAASTSTQDPAAPLHRRGRRIFKWIE